MPASNRSSPSSTIFRSLPSEPPGRRPFGSWHKPSNKPPAAFPSIKLESCWPSRQRWCRRALSGLLLHRVKRGFKQVAGVLPDGAPAARCGVHVGPLLAVRFRQYHKMTEVRSKIGNPRVAPIFAPQNRRSEIRRYKNICVLLRVARFESALPSFCGTEDYKTVNHHVETGQKLARSPPFALSGRTIGASPQWHAFKPRGDDPVARQKRRNVTNVLRKPTLAAQPNNASPKNCA